MAQFTVSASVVGLVGSGLVLKDQSGAELAVSAQGGATQRVTFVATLPAGTPFDVTVKTQPSSPPQNCVVTGGQGTVVNGNVETVTVNCTTRYTVGGTVSGLAGQNLVLQNNAGDDAPVNINGQFAFPTPLASGAAYAVTVKSQPTNRWQTCAVTTNDDAGSSDAGNSVTGTIAMANVTNVSVTCTTNNYNVSVRVAGLDGTGLTFQNTLANDLAVAMNGTYAFATKVASGDAYSVTVRTNPTSKWQTCTVQNPMGAMAGDDVTLDVSCATNKYKIKGTLTGLQGNGLVLRNNGGDDLTRNAADNGTFEFATSIDSGSAYAVTVQTQPTGVANERCDVASGSATVAGADITTVAVTCSTCGTDCFGATGCMTDAGRCVKFSCRAGNSGATFCDSCGGWDEITYDQWLNGGYCGDIIAKYRANHGTATACGAASPTCCGSAACAVGGGDNAWHFMDGATNMLVGPCLGCAGNTNCRFWNSPDTSSYTRITACIKR